VVSRLSRFGVDLLRPGRCVGLEEIFFRGAVEGFGRRTEPDIGLRVCRFRAYALQNLL
jgi:hypothetical protein